MKQVFRALVAALLAMALLLGAAGHPEKACAMHKQVSGCTSSLSHN